jgi:3-oxoacyl-[acyl-carrier-protein] synthase-3
MQSSASITALSVSFPSVVRTNDYWRRKYPEVMAKADEKTLARVFSATNSTAATSHFDDAMMPYVSDPFRGTVERRYLGPGESSVGVEVKAVKDVLAARGISKDEIDAMIVTSFVPDTVILGDAAHLAKAMDMRCPAWNLEAACTGGVPALQSAAALVRAGEYRRVLVVVACMYSRIVDEKDSLSWFMGDGSGAFIVEPADEGTGILATKLVSTADTCDVFPVDLIKDERGEPRMWLHVGPRAAQPRETSGPLLHDCVDGVLAKAGLHKDDIKCFVFNTPVAWFHDFGARALGVDPERTLTTYPSYANIGPALLAANLYHAARAGKIKKGDLVLCFGIGFTSHAAAMIMRWGDVALGPLPPASSELVRD